MFTRVNENQWQYNTKGLTVGLTYREGQQYAWQATINGTGFSGTTAKEALDKVLKQAIQQRMMEIQRADAALEVLAALYEKELDLEA